MRALALLLLCPSFVTLGGCGDGDEAHGTTTTGSGTKLTPDASLRLLREQKLSKLLGGHDAFEASGVAVVDGAFRVVFDDMTRIATVSPDLTSGTLSSGETTSSQYEAIATVGARTFVSVEGVVGRILELDASGAVVADQGTDLRFTKKNKGLEGLAWIGDDTTDRLLGLSEADGTAWVLRRSEGTWITEATLARPAKAAFDDFSDVAVRPRGDGSYDVAVLSQESSALWLGSLSRDPWQLVGPGRTLSAPSGGARYCTLEGVAFVDVATLVLVSDKSSSHDDCDEEQESIHVFGVP